MKAAVSAVLICACALAGCSTLSGLAETQSTVSKFDQGVRAVSTSEMNFLHQVQGRVRLGDVEEARRTPLVTR